MSAVFGSNSSPLFFSIERNFTHNNQNYKIDIILDKISKKAYCLKLFHNNKKYLFYIKDHGNSRKGDCLEADSRDHTSPMQTDTFKEVYPILLSEFKEILEKAKLPPGCEVSKADVLAIGKIFDDYSHVPHLCFDYICTPPKPICLIIKGQPTDNGCYYLSLKDDQPLKNIFAANHGISTFDEIRERVWDVPLTDLELKKTMEFARQHLHMMREKYKLTEIQVKQIEEGLDKIQKLYQKSPRLMALTVATNNVLVPYFRLADERQRYYYFSIENEFKVEAQDGTFHLMGEEDYKRFLGYVSEFFDQKELFESMQLRYGDFLKNHSRDLRETLKKA